MAGIAVWLALGAFIGFFAGKVTRTGGSFGVGSNTGVAMVAAIAGGFVTTLLWHGEKSGTGLFVSTAVAGIAALLAIFAFRIIYPTRSPRFEDGQNRLR